jgi:hypothetical protein
MTALGILPVINTNRVVSRLPCVERAFEGAPVRLDAFSYFLMTGIQ